MLNIKSLNEFRSNVISKEEIRENSIGKNLNSFCYMISSEETFNDAWARECRGIVFNSNTGHVVSRPLHKFFNVNEREETRVENLDWSKVTRVMDKRDGSMIHTVITDDGFKLKSKKTFDSDVAKAATAWLETQEGNSARRVCQYAASNNLTAIFEWTSPDARIVLFYPEKKLTLLHIRDNVTGEYFPHHKLELIKQITNVDLVLNLVTKYGISGTDLLKQAQSEENIEGWIVQFEDGNMVKIKTKWYLERHRAMTFLRERDIAESVLNESIDDLKSLLVTENVNIDEILQIEVRVLHEICKLTLDVNSIFETDKHLSRKDFAIKHTGSPIFGLLMAKFTGKEPDVKGFFERTMLKDMFSLRQLALFPSVAEVE